MIAGPVCKSCGRMFDDHEGLQYTCGRYRKAIEIADVLCGLLADSVANVEREPLTAKEIAAIRNSVEMYVNWRNGLDA